MFKNRYNQLVLLVLLLLTGNVQNVLAQSWSPVSTLDGSFVTPRHESNAVEFDGYIYVFGGRRERPVDRYDPSNNIWETVTQAPVEMHHFQPVVYDRKIYIIGAFTCCYPLETTLQDIHIFDPATNTWSTEGTMPTSRLRGSAGTFTYNNKIYVVGGNTAGHSGGAVPWFDEYDPATGNWRVLPDAPNARDHVAVAMVGTKLVAAAGRQSNIGAGNTVAATDVYDFSENKWILSSHDVPTERAGTMAVTFNDMVYVIGGESTSLTTAHPTVEVFNPTNGTWRGLENMITPRHAGGAALIGSDLHVFTGSTTRGGGDETNLHEKINLAQATTTALTPTPPDSTVADNDADQLTNDDENNQYGTDPNNADTDGDGLDDYTEIFTTNTDPNLLDTDQDGLNDKAEFDQDLNPNNADTDGDGLTDGDEIAQYSTDPLETDTDTDGVSDGDEILLYETNPTSNDSDSDGLDDGIEINELNSDPLLEDSDADGLTDSEEYNLHGTNPVLMDSDEDGLSDHAELFTHFTNPLSADSDGDFLTDGDEVNTYESDPLATDSDGDGISDNQEVALGSSLNNNDEDGDGLINSVDGADDSDGDGLPNYVDLDSDNDSIPDVIELGYSDVNRDGMLDTEAVFATMGITPISGTVTEASTRLLDTDNDGVPNYIDLDSDQDGIPDLAEARANYSSNSQRLDSFTDDDQNGLSDLYNNPDSIIPADSDRDSIYNFLDLDSDNDEFMDITETGTIDSDADGKLDNFIDQDRNGISDVDIPALGSQLPDEDGDSIPDLIDSSYNPSGCSVMGNGAHDPTISMLFLFSILYLTRRRIIRYTLKEKGEYQ